MRNDLNWTNNFLSYLADTGSFLAFYLVLGRLNAELVTTCIDDVRKRMVTRLTNLSNKYKYFDEPF